MTVGEAVKVLEMMADENTLLQIDKVKEVTIYGNSFASFASQLH